MLDFAPREYQYAGMFILALLLLRIPAIGPYFRGLNTMFHESGHAFFALLLTGKFSKVDLHADTSGSCKYTISGWLRDLFINLGGYPFGTAAAVAMFYFLHKGNTDYVFYGLAGWLILNLLFWVRNRFGWFWILTYGAMLAGCYYLQNEALTYYFLFFSAALNLMEAVYSSLVILWLSADEPGHAGDTTNLRQITYVPAVVWGLVFATSTIYGAGWVVQILFGWNFLPF
ncbi:MAG: M50 family metallopeptidase [Flavobacteriales bacterium]